MKRVLQSLARIGAKVRNRSPFLTFFLLVLSTYFPGFALTAQEKGVDFESEVVPILAGHCIECHNSREKSGGLDLTSKDAFQAGGDSGIAIDRANFADSLILARVRSGEMPPPQQGKPRPLSQPDTSILEGWVSQQAPWPDGRVIDLYERTTTIRGGRDWWAFQPLRTTTEPLQLGGSASQELHPIDYFVQQNDLIKQHSQAPLADRRTLIRRATFDLLGLPPTLEEVEAFEGDTSIDAWPRLIDRLLDSPHFGERWARHWLDAVRFAETCGYERDQIKPGIWRYRDWVVDAFNSDMPYKDFLTLQLAGDEVEGRSERTVVATGMIRAGTWNDEPNDPADYEYERIEDMVNTCSTAFLGLTVRCARCHDHKFDPIPQRDYYRFASFFWSGYIGQANLGGPSSEQLGFDRLGWTDRGSSVPPIRLLHKGERSQPGEEVEPGFLSALPQLDQPLKSPNSEKSATTQRRLQWAQWMTDPKNPLTARVIVNRIWLHHFGKGIVRTPDNFGFKGDLPTHLELLDFLAQELQQPRYGIKDQSERTAQEWRMKRIHRLIMTSHTYMQSSSHPLHDSLLEIDSANRSWWHFERRRLDAESLRDAMLKVSGRWNPALGGPSFYPSMNPEALEGLSRKEGDWQPSPIEEQSRRSLYMMTKRSRLLPFMTTFDFTDTISPCGQRDSTNVAPQALAMLNNDFVHEQSRALADRVHQSASGSIENQIRTAWMYAWARSPSQRELDLAIKHLETQTEHLRSRIDSGASTVPADQVDLYALYSLCHVLLNANEFLYVD